MSDSASLDEILSHLRIKTSEMIVDLHVKLKTEERTELRKLYIAQLNHLLEGRPKSEVDQLRSKADTLKSEDDQLKKALYKV